MTKQIEFLEPDLGSEAGKAVLTAIARRVVAARCILITTHQGPDGDALGSELGLARGLSKIGKVVRVVNSDPAPKKYGFLDPQGSVVAAGDSVDPQLFEGVDLGILLDTSTPARTGKLEPRFFGSGLERVCLDHHPGPQSLLFLHHWIATAAPAAGCLVLRLLDALGIEIDREIAVPLFVALATDTGWFRYTNTTPLALRDAARLVAAGVDTEGIYERVYADFLPQRIAVLGKLLAGIQVELGGRFVWSLLDRAALDKSGLPLEELDGFSEQLKVVKGADVVAAVIETAPGQFKVSLRSRGKAQVNAIAASFGGGGHVKAAGFRLEGTAQSVIDRLRLRVAESLGLSGQTGPPGQTSPL